MNRGPTERSDIGPQWVKANAIGGAINIAVTFVAFLVGRILGVNEIGAAIAVQAAFVILATAMLAFGLLAIGYLCGVVLRSKLPAFPMRLWLALYMVLGVIFGVVSALAWLTPETQQEPEPVDIDFVIGLAVGAVIAGIAIGAAVASLQALIMRPVAEGLGLWVGCGTLAGASFVLIVPAIVYGPQSGFGSELTVECVTLVVTVLAALVTLPAVHRLVPRRQTSRSLTR